MIFFESFNKVMNCELNINHNTIDTFLMIYSSLFRIGRRIILLDLWQRMRNENEIDVLNFPENLCPHSFYCLFVWRPSSAEDRFYDNIYRRL